MEKETWANEKDVLPISEPHRPTYAARSEKRRWRPGFRTAFAIFAVVGWNLVVLRDRSLQAARELHGVVGGPNPDARGKLTVAEAEELFL